MEVISEWLDQTKTVGMDIAQNVAECIFEGSECSQFWSGLPSVPLLFK